MSGSAVLFTLKGNRGLKVSFREEASAAKRVKAFKEARRDGMTKLCMGDMESEPIWSVRIADVVRAEVVEQ